MANIEADLNRSYTQKHPLRMLSSALMVGTALGASLMAAKKNREKGSLQKFMDNVNDRFS